jgi:Tol biopolymer transport system component
MTAHEHSRDDRASQATKTLPNPLRAALFLVVLLGCGEAHSDRGMGQNVPMLRNNVQAGRVAEAAGGQAPPPGAGRDVSQPNPAAPPPPIAASASEPPRCNELPPAIAKRWLAFDSDRGYNRDLYLVHADGTNLTRLTKEPATEREPSFAPDATRLAFASDASGSLQIYALDLKGGQRTQLTHQAGGADQPNWSVDGKQILFHSGASVYIMDANGENVTLIATGLDDFNAYKYPTLSPDGSEVVFDRNNEIDAVHVDGTQQRFVVQNWTTTEETPAISPDGYNVAYAVRCGSSAEQIAVVPLAGYTADPCAVTFATSPAIGSARRPAWGPDAILAFERSTPSGDATASTNIAITEGPGKQPCTVTDGAFQSKNPNWAPENFEPTE